MVAASTAVIVSGYYWIHQQQKVVPLPKPIEIVSSSYLPDGEIVQKVKTLPPLTPSPSPSQQVMATVPSARQWHQLRWCESNERYRINTGNGFSGAYQFKDSTWQAMGGVGSAYQASRAEQDRRALKLYRLEGADPWPVCGRYLP
jgi:Transglycosylase-like domain